MFYFAVSGTLGAQAFMRLAVITLGNSAGGVLIPLLRRLPE